MEGAEVLYEDSVEVEGEATTNTHRSLLVVLCCGVVGVVPCSSEVRPGEVWEAAVLLCCVGNGVLCRFGRMIVQCTADLSHFPTYKYLQTSASEHG